MPNTNIRGTLPAATAQNSGQVSAAEPKAPKMKTGRRPTRSESFAQSGIAPSAAMLARMSTRSVVDCGIFASRTA